VTINLENGKQFIITANRNEAADYYVQSVKLNSKAYSPSYISHTDIMEGGELAFRLGSLPNKKWGSNDSNVPVTKITSHLITAVPYFVGEDKKFKRSMSVIIKGIEPHTAIYFATTSLHDSTTTKVFKKYTTPIAIKQSTTVYAYAVKNGIKSKPVVQDFYKIPEDKSVRVISRVNKMYTAGGPDALIDGVVGEANYRTGEWQGYVGTDFEAIVDLKKSKAIMYVGAHFLQNVGSWIWMPTSVIFEASQDGTSFQPLGEVKNTVSDKDYQPSVKEFGLKVNTNARFVRVKAINYGKIRDWHPGKDGDAHIFVDEITVR
jgi:hypothetical protein